MWKLRVQKNIQFNRCLFLKVCGGVAGKHHAYGGKVCHSCRAFFRRSGHCNKQM